MSYNPNIPGSGQSLGETQSGIQQNFADINTRFQVNHIAFNDSGGGKHKPIQIPEASAPSTAANEGAIYTKAGSNPSETNLFFRAESNGYEYQLTHAISASTTQFSTNTEYIANHYGGWCFLPGGLILQYGRRTSPGSNGTVTFPLVFPSGAAPFSIILTNERTSSRSSSVNSVGITSVKFDYEMETGGSAALNWIAIGI